MLKLERVEGHALHQRERGLPLVEEVVRADEELNRVVLHEDRKAEVCTELRDLLRRVAGEEDIYASFASLVEEMVVALRATELREDYRLNASSKRLHAVRWCVLQHEVIADLFPVFPVVHDHRC